jgi:hypothetical protein
MPFCQNNSAGIKTGRHGFFVARCDLSATLTLRLVGHAERGLLLGVEPSTLNRINDGYPMHGDRLQGYAFALKRPINKGAAPIFIKSRV